MTDGSANLAAFLLDGKDPSRVALRTLDHQHTYGELHSAAVDVASYLVGAGGQKGDRVVLISENSFFWVAAYLGILRAGLVAVPLPNGISAEDLDYVLWVTEARFAFLQAAFAVKNGARFDRAQLVTNREMSNWQHPSAILSFAQMRSAAAETGPVQSEVDRDDLAALMFTSGSTGRPRGVMVSHGNIMANTESIIQYLRLTGADRIMAVLPFHYCFGTSLLHTHLRVGASLVVDSRFMYPEAILQRMRETECTGFAGVPSHFQILLRSSSLKKERFPHLRYVQQAGGHLAPAFLRELREALPETQVFVMYGQTEATARLAYLPPEFLEDKLGSIGKAIPGVVLRVLNESGEEVRPGKVGEIVAEGANVTHGYWRAPEDSANSFRNGKLYTGDLATVDADGFIYVVDRAKDFVKCGGKRISCRQVEESLLEFEHLLEAAVVGMADEILGEAVKAFVVPRNHQDSQDLPERLQLFCKGRMPPLLIPKKIVVVRSLPKNSAGKVLKQQLKNAAAEENAGPVLR